MCTTESVFSPSWAERVAFISGTAGRGAGPKQWLKIAANCCTMASFWRKVRKQGGGGLYHASLLNLITPSGHAEYLRLMLPWLSVRCWTSGAGRRWPAPRSSPPLWWWWTLWGATGWRRPSTAAGHNAEIPATRVASRARLGLEEAKCCLVFKVRSIWKVSKSSSCCLIGTHSSQLHGDIQVAVLGAVVARLLQSFHPGLAESCYAPLWQGPGARRRGGEGGQREERADPGLLALHPLG